MIYLISIRANSDFSIAADANGVLLMACFLESSDAAKAYKVSTPEGPVKPADFGMGDCPKWVAELFPLKP